MTKEKKPLFPHSPNLTGSPGVETLREPGVPREAAASPVSGGGSGRGKRKDSRRNILDAALREFAAHGFEGARVDRIARMAEVNKAMIFYYFSSKQGLYSTVLREALMDFVPRVEAVLEEARDPATLFASLPSLYIRYFSHRREVIQMIIREMIHFPQRIAPIVRDFFPRHPRSPSRMIRQTLTDWHRRGLISESDPAHFIFNIIPLCLFPIIARPMVEAILGASIPDEDKFLEERIRSITRLLERGMLP